jgi:hypothetical protein
MNDETLWMYVICGSYGLAMVSTLTVLAMIFFT